MLQIASNIMELKMALEGALRGRVSGWLREAGFFCQPIETGGISDGVPDLFYTHNNPSVVNPHLTKPANGWLELKKIKEMPKRSYTAIFKSINHPLSIEQANWIGRCIESGTRADILVGFGREYFFVPGSKADNFNELTEPQLRQYTITREQLIVKLRGLDMFSAADRNPE